ncbi:MAG: hypothetical protein EPO45_17300 [Sphingobium sp.]|nr:MAG: hypothetical protein EPO45_17300 [Sphingobium sp.]
MTNNFLQTAFAIPVTPEEAALLEECFAVANELSSDFAELPIDGMQTVKSYYGARSDAFKTAFPKKPEEDDPFAGFFDLWSDPGFLGFDADLSIRGDPEAKAQFAFISGHDVDVPSIASLIQKVCKSALPFGFQWAEGHEEEDGFSSFAGGYYVISDTGIFGGPTRWLMNETLQTLRAGAT